MLKLKYIYIGGSEVKTSVQRKVVNQIYQLNFNGIPTEGWFFSDSVDSELKLNDFITIFPLKTQQVHKKYFKSYFDSDAINAFVYDFIEDRITDSDILFIRHYRTTRNYIKILKKYAKKIILYIPSNTIAENFRERQVNQNAGLISKLLSWWEYFRCFYVFEFYLLRNLISRLKSVVVFTPEFAEIIKSKAWGSVRVIYNRDGVACNEVPCRKINAETHDNVIKLLFMKGSSMQQSWSGLERLVESIEHNGKNRFQLFITGRMPDPRSFQKDFITLTGNLSMNDLIDLVNKVDLGVSNLSNYLIGFNSTANLKSREYYARGLPFIQANNMPDIDQTEAKKYYLNIPNLNQTINMDAIYDFAIKMRKDENHPFKMRSFAEENLDWKITVKELAESLRKIQ